MALTAGTRFGPYEVVNAIGAGGMGEVYRARDPRLRRDVAIKVLPRLVASDPERLARFEREAQTLAALNHPHIATIFGLEESTGGIRGLVMEIVEGPTLSDRIAQGPVPWVEALTIARQIADALESAHEKGIVHRDVKPANVKLTPEGEVKVLDFGLAKAMDPSATGDEVSNSPTVTARATQLGVILGTAAYMSPEQARGKIVDRRADIWAFGCVLYEMVTGRRVFEGAEITDILARLIERDPDWSALPAGTSPEMRRLLSRCLTKDPKARLRDIGEARVVIDETIAGASSTPASSGVPTAAAPPAPRWARLLPWGLAAVLGIAAFVLFLRPAAAPAFGATVRAEVGMPAEVEFFAGPTLSGDGTKLAFVGVRQGIRGIYLRALDEADVKRVAGTDGASLLSLSADGSALAFVTADTWLKRITLASGVVEPIADGADTYSGPAWATDGSLVFSRRGRLVVWPAGGGAERELAKLDTAAGETHLSWPLVIAHDTKVLFTSRRNTPSGPKYRLDVVPFVGGARRVVLDGVEEAVLASENRIVYAQGTSLFEAGFDPAAGAIVGAPTRLGENIYVGVTGSAVAASTSGALLFAPQGLFSSHLVWVSPAGVEHVIDGPPRGFQNPRVSPDGRRIAFSESGTIWTLDPERSTFTRVSAGSEPTVGFPVWSLDSKRIYYCSAEGIRVRSADGEGETTVLTVPPNTSTSDYPSTLTPDGASLVFLRITAETGGDIYSMPATGGEIKPILVTKAYEGGPQVSPDGKWLLYVSSESGHMEVSLRPLSGPDRKWTVSNGGGLHPLWSRDGKRAFYRSGQQFFEVDVTTSPEVRLSRPKVLFERRYEFGANLTFPNFSISADGREFLMIQSEPGSRHLNLAINWLQRPGR